LWRREYALEQAFERDLQGEQGIAVKQNMSGRWFIISKDNPKDGYNVVTTLNVKMQDQVTWIKSSAMTNNFIIQILLLKCSKFAFIVEKLSAINI
jgi:cell division protein FtsI/penicillin-binding protein 2